jgi:hypothetical protein
MEVVYAKDNAAVPMVDGGTVFVSKGSHWPADDPAVKMMPSLFTRDARYGMQYSVEPAGYNDEYQDTPVETATRAPGEKRPYTRRNFAQ